MNLNAIVCVLVLYVVNACEDDEMLGGHTSSVALAWMKHMWSFLLEQRLRNEVPISVLVCALLSFFKMELNRIFSTVQIIWEKVLNWISTSCTIKPATGKCPNIKLCAMLVCWSYKSKTIMLSTYHQFVCTPSFTIHCHSQLNQSYTVLFCLSHIPYAKNA